MHANKQSEGLIDKNKLDPLILHCRNYYFDIMVLFFLILLIIALAVTLPSYLAEREYEIIALRIGIVVFILLIHFMRKLLSRGVLFFLLYSGIALTFFISIGPFYSRPGWLVLTPVAAALLFGAPAAIAITGLNAVLLMTLYLFIGPHFHSWALIYAAPISAWIIFVVNISVISLVASLPVSLLLTRLDFSFSQELDLRKELSQERESLQATNTDLRKEIADHKQAEEALKESEVRLADIIDFLPDATLVINHKGKVIAWNKAMESMTGVNASDMINKENYEYAIPFYGERRPILVDLILLPKEEIEKQYHHLVRRGDLLIAESDAPVVKGQKRFLSGWAHPLYDSSGQTIGAIECIRDITDHKQVEEEKAQLEAQLYQAQKMESIGTLAGGIAHNFNNLLTGILGNVSLALMNIDDGNSLRERLKNIEDCSRRGSDLTKQLLGFARGGKYEAKPTHLGKFIWKSSDMFGQTKKEIRIHHKSQEDLWTVNVDQGQMEQVLLNLYVNAWQAMPGGGDLYLSVENVELGDMDVSPHDIKPGKFVKVTVTDTGVGMDESIKAQIFDPFFTTKERGRGTGLGLASVYGIVKNHGGFVRVESKKNIGTSFMIYLPASDKKVEGEQRPEDEIRTGQETILLIDDEEMILDIGSKMLEGIGYHVMTAAGGRQGLQIYETDPDKIDLVILDMIMPGYSGEETFDALRQINPSVRVLVSSGYSIDRQAKEVLRRGCKGFIQKPLTLVELSRKIRGILDEQ